MDKAEKVAFYIHNHPSNTPYPSGLDTGGGDIRAAKDFSNILGYSIRNEIYVSILKAYIPYSTFSNICGFPQYIKWLSYEYIFKDIPNYYCDMHGVQ